MSSVVLLSGGLDSSANLALAVERDSVVLALTADYGQRAFSRELEAAREFARYYGVRHEVVDLRWLGRLGGSALTEASRAMPSPGSSQLDDRAICEESARAVWVPNRNGVFLNVAAAWAERMGAARVVLGFNREEAATFPDNSGAFLRAASAALEFSTGGRVQAFSYTTEMDKREIVRALVGLSRPFPFERVWSCYEGEARPCLRCESCRRLERAMWVRSEGEAPAGAEGVMPMGLTNETVVSGDSANEEPA